jgi:hypothetical protein
MPEAARHQGSIDHKHFDCDVSVSYMGKNLPYRHGNTIGSIRP